MAVGVRLVGVLRVTLLGLAVVVVTGCGGNGNEAAETTSTTATAYVLGRRVRSPELAPPS
jgi:hypothetical protein